MFRTFGLGVDGDVRSATGRGGAARGGGTASAAALIQGAAFTHGAGAAQAAPERSIRRPLTVTVFLMVVVLFMSVASLPAHALTLMPLRFAATWDAAFQLEPGVTYTYTLEHDMLRGRDRMGNRDRDGYWIRDGQPGRGTPPLRTAGELNFSRVGHRDEIRFWFDIDGVLGNGTASNDIRALAGAVLVAALTGPEPLSADAVRLLATVFQWTQWYDLFTTSTFRDGLVWQVSQHPPHRFTAVPLSGRRAYFGELTRGRDLVLEIGIDLHEPLPWEIVAYSGREYFRAEWVRQPTPGLRR